LIVVDLKRRSMRRYHNFRLLSPAVVPMSEPLKTHSAAVNEELRGRDADAVMIATAYPMLAPTRLLIPASIGNG
jgi:hypothetical protein